MPNGIYIIFPRKTAVPSDDSDDDYDVDETMKMTNGDVWLCDMCYTDSSTVWSGNSTATYMGQPSSSNYCTLLSQVTLLC